MSKLGFDNDTQFELSSDRLPPVVVNEPKNWNDDDKSYEKDDKGGGTLLKKNTELEFRGDGYNFIYSHILAFGYSSQVSVNKTGKDVLALNEKWRSLYRSKLDILNATYTEKGVSVSFTQGGLYDAIIARYTDTYNLVSRKSADNLDITELSTVLEQVAGRAIERKSLLDVEDGKLEEISVTGGDDDTARAVPFDIVTNSDSDFINGITPGANSVFYSEGEYADGETSHMLYDRSDRNKTLLLNGKVKLQVLDTQSGTLRLEKVWYGFENDIYVFDRKETLATIDSGQNLGILEYDFINDEVNVDEGESFAIVLYENMNGSGSRDMSWEYLDTSLEILLDDLFPPTQSKVLLPHEAGDRFIEKITGQKGLFYSKTFGRTDIGYTENGEWSLLGCSSGFWARSFDIGEPIVNKDGEEVEEKQFNISFSKWFDSYSVIQPLYWGIELRNGKEYFRCENYNFINQDFIGIRLGRTILNEFQYIPCQKLERTILTDELFTSINIGFLKGGNDYEEVIGLSSVHGQAQFNTSLNLKENNVYSKISDIRADLEGYELARRKQSINTQDEDTEYDQDIFFRDLIKKGTGYWLRSYSDDFEGSLEDGIKGATYSPETMGNFRLTPFRCLLRHKKIIATGLFPEPNGFITFISSNCFSSIEIDGLKESGSIQNRELGKPYINGWLLSFEGKVYQEMIDQLEGFTVVDGERIPNFYGLFEAKTGTGELVRGRLISSKINGNGQHEIAEV